MRTCLLTFIAIVLGSSMVTAQDVGPVSILDAGVSPAISSTLLQQIDATRLPLYFGWNWGLATNKINRDLHTNVWHLRNYFGPNNAGVWYDDAPTSTALTNEHHELSKTVPKMRLIMEPNRPLVVGSNYVAFITANLPWYSRLYNEAATGEKKLLKFGGDDPISLTEGMGIRFQPELVLPSDPAASPFAPISGDLQGCVFGFRTKAVGAVSGERFALDQSGAIPVQTVLSGCWPNDKFAEWEEHRDDMQASPFNGRRMYLAINLRRTEATDVADNNDVILRLYIKYEKCNGDTGHVIFDSLPRATTALGPMNIALPNTLSGTARGLASTLEPHRTGTPQTQLVVTRAMLPHGDAGDPDITLMAHCIFDPDPFENQIPIPPSPPDLFPDVTNVNPYLKSVWHKGCGGGDENMIKSLDVIVAYEGRSDIAIDWVQLGTDNMTYFTQGYYDNYGYEAFRDNLQDLATFNSTQARHSSSGDALRLYRWYNRDEGDKQYWEGMRYFNLLFDKLTITEKGVEDDFHRFNHIIEPTDPFTWQGATTDFLHNTVAPYYKEGYHTNWTADEPARRSLLNNEWGMNTPDVAGPIDYDVRWGSWPSAPPATQLDLPANLAQAEYPGISTGGLYHAGGSIQQRYEFKRYKLMLHPDHLFSTMPWVANSWLLSQWDANSKNDGQLNNTTNMLGVVRGMWRPYSAEETRLAVWSELILGSKGLFIYWGVNLDSIVNATAYDAAPRDFGICDNLVKAFTDNLTVRNDATANAMSNHQNHFSWDDPRAGADFIKPVTDPCPSPSCTVSGCSVPPCTSSNLAYGYRTGLYNAINGGTGRVTTIATALGVGSDRLYLGTLSMRKAVKEITDVLWRGQDTISKLQLIEWYSHGFRNWDIPAAVSPASLPLDAIFGSDRTKFRTRHLWRDVLSPITQPYLAARTYEDFDSAFFEVTLFDYDSKSRNEQFVVGVLNRRCNPFLIGESSTADYVSYPEWQANLSLVAPELRGNARFKQKGAREIELPFDYHHPDGKYRNLRVREVGAENLPILGHVALDTIIGQDQVLHVNFLPGEGKFLHVTVLSPVAMAEQPGFLDHSNQRKLVYYPKVLGITPETDPVTGNVYWPTTYDKNYGYYHMVYYRRRTEPDGKLSVYYRRSTPIVGNRVNDASHLSTITWEPEILLSDDVRYDFSGDGTPEVYDPDCAYPALVARYDHLTNKSKVYAVYACETQGGAWGGMTPGCATCDNILIVESILDAETTTQATDYAASSATGIAVATQPVVHSLKDWGTPSVNASYGGNWYAWSSYADGINVNYKEPNLTRFNQGVPARVNLPILNNAGLKATHPSLNTYSRQHIGEVDAALVWQEGEYNAVPKDLGQYIHYTRLRLVAPPPLPAPPPPNVGQPEIYLFPNYMVGATVVSGNLNYNAARTIAELQGPTGGFRHLYPVLFRHLSDYATNGSSPYHQLRLVNHKAERVMWQRESNVGAAPSMIMRRAFDFKDNTLRPGLGTPDEGTAMGTYVISATGQSLCGPDISQGWNYSEHVGGQAPVGPWYEDSVTVLNFWSTSSPPTIWHMQYGFGFYGAPTNHTVSGLQLAGQIEPLTTRGHYPHLAARGTMSFDPAFGKNRRIYNNTDGFWPDWSIAPHIIQSSEQFFKEHERPYQVELMHGFRNDESDLSVSTILLNDHDVYPLMATMNDQNTVTQYYTDWFTVPQNATQSMAILSTTEQAAATLSIERELDGEKLNLYLGNAIGKGEATRSELTLLDGGADRYRVVVEPIVAGTQGVEDISISFEQGDQEKSLLNKRVVNLRTMSEQVIQSGIAVEPKVATDEVIVSMLKNDDLPTDARTLHLTITDALGTRYLQTPVEAISTTRVQVSRWPSGLYTAQVTSMLNGRTVSYNTTFLVMH